MRRVGLALVLLATSTASHAQADDQARQRALIERDQQSEAFSRQLRQSQEALRVPPGDAARRRKLDLQQLQERHDAANRNAAQLRDAGKPLVADPAIARELQPYERERTAGERRAAERPPGVEPAEAPPAPLPLPGAAHRGVDPVTPDRFPD